MRTAPRRDLTFSQRRPLPPFVLLPLPRAWATTLVGFEDELRFLAMRCRVPPFSSARAGSAPRGIYTSYVIAAARGFRKDARRVRNAHTPRRRAEREALT